PQGPHKVFDDTDPDPSERSPDQPVTNDGGAYRGADRLQGRLVEGQPRLIAAVGDPWGPEIDPRGHCGPGRKDQPESAEAIDIRKRIYEREQSHHAAYRRASEPQEPLLIARPDGRQRYDEAGDHGGVDAGIVEADEQHVADQRGQ